MKYYLRINHLIHLGNVPVGLSGVHKLFFVHPFLGHLLLEYGTLESWP